MWQVIGRYKNNYKETVTIKNIVFNQNTETSPQKIATEFNKYYLSIAGNIKRTLPPPAHFVFLFDTYEGAGVSELRYATQTEIIRTVKKMKNKDSRGWDGISCSLLNSVISTVIEPLTTAVNAVFEFGQFPEELKLAIVSPIFKSGETTDPSNYRPISVLPVFSKVIERLIYVRLIECIETNKTLNKHQHGFRRGYSTDSAMFQLTEFLLMAIDRREICVGLFLDLSKAFDCVDHDLLLK